VFPIDQTEVDMSVVVDCDTCVMRGLACHDCVVTVLLGPPPELEFDEEQQRALAVLADSGLVPRLRMVQSLGDGLDPDGADRPAAATGFA
jgi:hypothetical protein